MRKLPILLLFIALSCNPSKKAEKITLVTDDGVSIHADLYLAGKSGKQPLVILLHQGGSDRREWEFMIPELQKNNFAVLNADLREHGLSQKTGEQSDLYTDPNRAPRDLAAIVAFASNHPNIDATRIGIIGSSIGGNLAIAGNGVHRFKTVVALSVKTSAIKNLGGGKDPFLARIYFIASDGDGEGERARWAMELFQKTGEPKKIDIAPKNGSHGVSIIRENPGLRQDIVTWLLKTL